MGIKRAINYSILSPYSGTGKTTLLCKIIPLLTQKGLRVGIIKHAHHARTHQCRIRGSSGCYICNGAEKMEFDAIPQQLQ
ncbi:MAG TPA: hypothetical protein EYH20_02995 [Leucothrix sp.]|nr:hypothetical protein [Leucothrix sp.]